MNISTLYQKRELHQIHYSNLDLLPGAPVLLSKQEAAGICHVSVQTIARMVSAGLIKQNQDGDILKADLIDYVLNNTLADMPVIEE